MTVDKKNYFCMYLQLNNLVVTVNYIYKKQRPSEENSLFLNKIRVSQQGP